MTQKISVLSVSPFQKMKQEKENRQKSKDNAADITKAQSNQSGQDRKTTKIKTMPNIKSNQNTSVKPVIQKAAQRGK
ncbi:hypothetical protein [Candidatus Deianiraea vastatrix]|uniref:Uncharacterized protein n=1 Tax=Candidatus Deianiraea vastatrix TaxID=2163644 RepID=A0A5B8XC51_9RICK|nr:hypothetical protein [Candidatus Deianiraea vastatrix]QED22929.1 hypothetical protein Deia_00117 [Candidatus Deianiraea vastatrix]